MIAQEQQARYNSDNYFVCSYRNKLGKLISEYFPFVTYDVESAQSARALADLFVASLKGAGVDVKLKYVWKKSEVASADGIPGCGETAKKAN
jgi:hypothetical protein